MCFETLDDLVHEQNGILRTSDALARGITKSQFYEYVNSAKLEKAAHGIYVSADMLTDELYLLQAQFPRAVFSHEAALYLHDLSEYEPIPLTVTVPASYNSTGLTRKGVKVYYVKPEWYTLGLIEIPSFGGHMVHAYDLERTICDVIRRSEMMDVSAFNYLLQESYSWVFPYLWSDVWKPVLLEIGMILLEFFIFWRIWRRKATT